MPVSTSVQRRSPPATAPARRRAETRSRLVASATELFAERGLHGVTTHDIAARAGVAAGTFYLHFRDKETLLREIVEGAIARLRERLDAVTPSPPGSRENVRPFTEALLAFAEENRPLVRILFSRESEAAGVEADVLNEFAHTIAARRRARIDAGELPADLDPEVLSQALVGQLARVVAWWVEDPSRAPRERVVETLARIQLSGTHPD